jgi:hypothetical protein
VNEFLKKKKNNSERRRGKLVNTGKLLSYSGPLKSENISKPSERKK